MGSDVSVPHEAALRARGARDIPSAYQLDIWNSDDYKQAVYHVSTLRPTPSITTASHRQAAMRPAVTVSHKLCFTQGSELKCDGCIGADHNGRNEWDWNCNSHRVDGGWNGSCPANDCTNVVFDPTRANDGRDLTDADKCPSADSECLTCHETELQCSITSADPHQQYACCWGMLDALQQAGGLTADTLHTWCQGGVGGVDASWQFDSAVCNDYFADHCFQAAGGGITVGDAGGGRHALDADPRCAHYMSMARSVSQGALSFVLAGSISTELDRYCMSEGYSNADCIGWIPRGMTYPPNRLPPSPYEVWHATPSTGGAAMTRATADAFVTTLSTALGQPNLRYAFAAEVVAAQAAGAQWCTWGFVADADDKQAYPMQDAGVSGCTAGANTQSSTISSGVVLVGVKPTAAQAAALGVSLTPWTQAYSGGTVTTSWHAPPPTDIPAAPYEVFQLMDVGLTAQSRSTMDAVVASFSLATSQTVRYAFESELQAIYEGGAQLCSGGFFQEGGATVMGWPWQVPGTDVACGSPGINLTSFSTGGAWVVGQRPTQAEAAALTGVALVQPWFDPSALAYDMGKNELWGGRADWKPEMDMWPNDGFPYPRSPLEVFHVRPSSTYMTRATADAMLASLSTELRQPWLRYAYLEEVEAAQVLGAEWCSHGYYAGSGSRTAYPMNQDGISGCHNTGVFPFDADGVGGGMNLVGIKPTGIERDLLASNWDLIVYAWNTDTDQWNYRTASQWPMQRYEVFQLLLPGGSTDDGRGNPPAMYSLMQSVSLATSQTLRLATRDEIANAAVASPTAASWCSPGYYSQETSAISTMYPYSGAGTPGCTGGNNEGGSSGTAGITVVGVKPTQAEAAALASIARVLPWNSDFNCSACGASAGTWTSMLKWSVYDP